MGDEVRGIGLDAQTRCRHYHSPLDVVAIKLKCCNAYFACKECHDAIAGHPIEPWPFEEQTQRAVLCGACRSELTIAQYLASADRCPICSVPFNPGCRADHPHYFNPSRR